MKLVDMDFLDAAMGVRGVVEFTYAPKEGVEPKFSNVVSLKKTDKESAFVFRVNSADKYFQIYFGGGRSVRGETKIGAASHVDKRCLLTVYRMRNFTFASLTSGGKKDVRLVMHRGVSSVRVGSNHYEEGRSESGIVVHGADFSQLPDDACLFRISSRSFWVTRISGKIKTT